MNVELRPGYRQTEIGVIPEDWEIEELGSIFEISAGGDLDREHFSSVDDPKYCYPIYANGLTNRGLYGYSDIYRNAANKITVTARGDIGSASYRSTSFTAIGRLLVLSPKAQCNLRFLTECINNCIDFAVESTGVPQLTAPQISKYVVAFPPTIKEQEAIADALSDADALIESLDQLLVKKHHLKQGTMQELLTGKKRLPGFSGEWRYAKLGDMASLINGRAYSLIEWEESGTPVIRLQNLTGRGEDFYYSNLTLPERQYCEDGDLLFMWSATFGPIIWRGPKAIFHYHIWKIECRQNHLDKQYLFQFLSDVTEKLKGSSTSGGTMLHLTKSGMEARAIVAPDYAEQVAIASILSDMDAEIAELETQLAKTRSLKQGMMHKLLTGEIRLI